MDKQTTIDLFGEIDSDFGNDRTSEIKLDELLIESNEQTSFFDEITINTDDFKITQSDYDMISKSDEDTLIFDMDEIVNSDDKAQIIAMVDNIDLTIQGIENAEESITDEEILQELNDEIDELKLIEDELIEEIKVIDQIENEVKLINELEEEIENLEYMGTIASSQEEIAQVVDRIDDLVEIQGALVEDVVKTIIEDDETPDSYDTIQISSELDETTIEVDNTPREKMIDTTKLTNNLGNFDIVANSETDEIAIKVEEEVGLVTKDEFGQVNIMVIGVGGCGCNVINRMIKQKNEQIKLIAIDTSEQTLENIDSDYKLLIGEEEFQGHGSGGDTMLAERAFEFAKPKIQALLKDVDMVFLAGGIGRGTGSTGLVKIGKFARELGILTIGFATLPRKIEANVATLDKYYPLVCDAVDSTIIVENERVAQNTKHLPINGVMAVADSMLIDGIKGVFELVTKPGKINLDYADIKTAFSDQGSSVMGIGFGRGENPVVKAIENAFHSEVVDFDSIKTAKTIIFNITCARQTITIDDATKGTEKLYMYGSGQNMNHLLFGYSYDESLGDEVKVTFIATGTTPADYDFTKSLTSMVKPPVSDPNTSGKPLFSETEIFGSKLDVKREKKEDNRIFPDFFRK
jgi:cell division protein FtsZ